MDKVERLINLIALLLNTRRPITVEEIRRTVPGYDQGDYQSFKRMFERDKEELRAVGIPVEMRFTDPWEIDEGYVIPKDRYYLPDPKLTPAETAALWIASSVVVDESHRGQQALLKLSIGSDVNPGGDPPWFRARLHLDAPWLSTVMDALTARKRLKFTYRTPGGNSKERQVDPYTLVHRNGGWYLAGHDHVRDEVRWFKLDRIAGEPKLVGDPDAFVVPDDFDPDTSIPREPWTGTGQTATVAFSPRVAGLVRQELDVEPVGEWKKWPTFEIEVAEVEGFLGWVLGYGTDAVLRKPLAMRKRLIEKLEAVTA